MKYPIQLSRILRLNLAMLMAGIGTFALIYCPQPILPLLADYFGVSAATSSLAVALTSAPMAAAIVIVSVLADRVQRRVLMFGSLLLASALTVATFLATDWSILLALRVATGFALAGVPAVAMSHISAETDDRLIGSTMGVYVAGTGVGGVLGRVGASIAADLLDWRWSFALTGLAGLAIAVAFVLLLPPALVKEGASSACAYSSVGSFIRLIRDRVLSLIYIQAFIFMGVFMTLFNYAGFHLSRPPFNLPQSLIGSIFLLALVGCVASVAVGWLSGRIDRVAILRVSLCLLATGIVVTLSLWTAVFVFGLVLIVVGFFGAHAVASSWVGWRAGGQAGRAAALYLFFYHLGSAVVSVLGGLVWQVGGWGAVAGFTVLLSLAAIAITGGMRSKDERVNAAV